MRWLGCVVAVLAGCGRFAFDSVTDANGDGVPSEAGDGPGDTAIDVLLANHDEDGDGVDDAVDVCPHLVDDQTDADHDGVGAACDPDDSVKKQHIAKFDPLVTIGTDLALQGGFVAGVDELVVTTGTFSQADWTLAITDADIWVGLQIDGQVGTVQQLIIHPSISTQTPRHYGQLYKNPSTSSNETTIVRYDGSNFVNLDQANLSAAGIHNGAIVLHLTARTNPGSVRFESTWIGEPYKVMASTPEYTGSPLVRFAGDGLRFHLKYLCVIATVP